MNLLTYDKKRNAFQHIIVLSTIIFLTPCFALGYSVSYEYYVYADDTEWVNMPIHTGSGGTTSPVILDGETSVSGEVRQDGNTGNYAAIKYSADIATGEIKSYEYAQSDNVYKSSATGRINGVGFSDTLTFTLAAGTYDDDVEISLVGAITGSLDSNLDAGARIQYYITFGFETLFHDYTVNPDEDRSINVNDPFSLTKILVTAGTELLTPTEFSYALTASFANDYAWATGSGAHSNSYNTGTYESVGEVDFYNTLQFTDVIVPDGVTWTSESGVFLSQTSPPVLSQGAPSGELPAGTTEVVLSLSSNEIAVCHYATEEGFDYSAMPNTFASTNSTSHQHTPSRPRDPPR